MKARDRGAVAIIVAVFAIVAMILLAFVIDRGRIYVERAQLQNAVDSSALAAVQATCDNPIANPSAVRQIAVDYGTLNGVPINPSDVIVQDGASDVTTGVSVAAERVVSSFFSGFLGISETTVAARGTATRQCRSAFQYVADKDTNFNGGTPNIAGNIFAGKCFDGEGGIYGGIVAVSLAGTAAAKDANCGSFLPGSATYAIWNDNAKDNGTDCPNDIGDCEYEVTGVTPTGAFLAAGYDKTTIDANLATAGACSAVTATMIDTGPVYCNGDLTFDNGWVIKYDIVVSGDIKDRSNTAFCGTFNSGAAAPFVANRVAIYSRDGTIDLQTNVDTGPCPRIPSNYVFFAPTSNGSQPAIRYTGGGSQMDAAFLGYDIVSNGEGATGGQGIEVRFAGPWRLSQ